MSNRVGGHCLHLLGGCHRRSCCSRAAFNCSALRNNVRLGSSVNSRKLNVTVSIDTSKQFCFRPCRLAARKLRTYQTSLPTALSAKLRELSVPKLSAHLLHAEHGRPSFPPAQPLVPAPEAAQGQPEGVQTQAIRRQYTALHSKTSSCATRMLYTAKVFDAWYAAATALLRDKAIICSLIYVSLIHTKQIQNSCTTCIDICPTHADDGTPTSV